MTFTAVYPTVLFADDIALYKEIISSDDQDLLQADLSNVLEWSQKWQLKLNPKQFAFLTNAHLLLHITS